MGTQVAPVECTMLKATPSPAAAFARGAAPSLLSAALMSDEIVDSTRAPPCLLDK